MRDRKLLLCAVLAVAGGAAACSHNDRAPATPSASTAPSAPDMTAEVPAPPAALPSQSSSDCPMAVEGSQVTVDRMDGGVAYVFITQTGDVAQLRDKVRKVADDIEHDQSATPPASPAPAPATSGAPGATTPTPAVPNVPSPSPIASTGAGSHKMSSVPAHAVVIDIDRGVRLELRPLRTEDLDGLRTHAEQHASKMASGQCPSDENAG